MKNLLGLLVLVVCTLIGVTMGLEKRIAGGSTVTPPFKYEWMAVLSFSEGDFCSATLIDPNWVLTSTYCVSGFLPTDLEVSFHRQDLNSEPEVETAVVRSVTQIVRYPLANVKTLYYDIALLRLSSPVSYTPALLDLTGAHSAVGTVVTILGWGVQDTEYDDNGLLNQVQYQIAPISACSSIYEKIDNNYLCTQFPTSGKGGCDGDEGSPIVYFDSEGNAFVESVYSYSGSCGVLGYPDVSSSVSAVASFLTSAVNVTNTCSAGFCQNGGTCINGIGFFSCDCTGTGYQGSFCEQASCSLSICKVQYQIPLQTGPNTKTLVATLNLSGQSSPLSAQTKIRVYTQILADNVADLTLTVRSPNGTTVTLSDRSISQNYNTFGGTLWEDGAALTLNDRFGDLGGDVINILGPIQPISTFVGTQTNGEWQLLATVAYENEFASILSWGIEIDGANHCSSNPCYNGGSCQDGFNQFTCTCSPPFYGIQCEYSQACVGHVCSSPKHLGLGILEYGRVATYSIYVSNQPGNLSDSTSITVNTDITHTSSEDLVIQLMGPTGLIINLAVNDGEFLSNVYAGVEFADLVGLPVGDLYFGVSSTVLSPNDALFNFAGSPANGYWTLIVIDMFTYDEGTLNSWSITFNYTSACESNWCLNGGTCISLTSGYACECANGYYGDNCEINLNGACASSPCSNQGTCTAGSDGVSFTCNCTPGYTGTTCTTWNPCASSPCLNQASCIVASDGNFTCSCASGYTGSLCDSVNDTSSKSSVNVGAIVGGIIGAIVFVALLLGLLYFANKKGYFATIVQRQPQPLEENMTSRN